MNPNLNQTTKFEIKTCSDFTCNETSSNGVIDISPDSAKDPIVWFKVTALTNERYLHLRKCTFNFENGANIEIIENGCSKNSQTTVLTRLREEISNDKFGHVFFMNSQQETKVSIRCKVDACLPEIAGLNPCAVNSGNW